MKDDLIKSPVIKSDIGTQTDTHLMESNLVKSYEWNEWELRRKAIKLVSYVGVGDQSVCVVWVNSLCVGVCEQSV